MLRPTKRFLIDLWGLIVLAVIVVFIRPWVGSPQVFSGVPATPTAIVVFYIVGLIVTGAVVRDMVRAIRNGGAFVHGRRETVILDCEPATWEWAARIGVRATEGVWFSGRCIHSENELVELTLGLAELQHANGAPRFSGHPKTFDFAWEAEAFPEGILIPERAGEYMLGVRVTGCTTGGAKLKLVWGLTRIRRG